MGIAQTITRNRASAACARPASTSARYFSLIVQALGGAAAPDIFDGGAEAAEVVCPAAAAGPDRVAPAGPGIGPRRIDPPAPAAGAASGDRPSPTYWPTMSESRSSKAARPMANITVSMYSTGWLVK